MTRPQISFYMTVRNGERYVRQALESIAAQDINSWEAVIVDDGSFDSTVNILEYFCDKDPRFRVEYTSGIGRGRALNNAVSLCRAEILTNLDADDLAHPQRARLLLSTMEQHPEFAVLAGRSQFIFDDERPDWILEWGMGGTLCDVTRKVALKNPFGHSAVGIRRAALLGVGGYEEQRASQFDYDLWVRLALAGYRLGSASVTVVAKRSHNGQSYERQAHMRYALRSAGIQWRAVRGLRSNPIVGGAIAGARVLWACLPVESRMFIRRNVDFARRQKGKFRTEP